MIKGLDFGIEVHEERAVGDPFNDVVGHRYADQIKTEQDLEKIQLRESCTMRSPPLHVCLNWKRSLTAFWRFDHKGFLGCDQFSIHCNGTYSDELPTPGFDPERPHSADLWTYVMAQIFSTVSPAMHKEFWLDYAVGWFERFGLGY